MWNKIFYYFLIVVFFVSIGWFLIYEHDKFAPLPGEMGPETTQETESIDWAPLVPGITSVALFFLRYYFLDRKKNLKKGKESLLDHSVFYTIEDMLENDIDHRTFGSEGRTEVMRVLIRTQLETYRDALKEFIVNNPGFSSQTDFRKKLRACIFDMVTSTEQKWQSKEIPQVLIKKYGALYKQRIDLLLSDVLTASFEDSLNDNALKTFLNDARIIFRTGLQEDVIIALTALNGELEGLTYKGKKL